MRLTDLERTTIKNAVLALDPNAEVFLFGSRVDDTKRGGDIDILVFSATIPPQHSYKILSKVFTTIEEQQIDIHIAPDLSQPFTRIAYHNALPL